MKRVYCMSHVFRSLSFARRIIPAILCLFVLAGPPANAGVNSPEDIIEAFFKSWRLQNHTWMLRYAVAADLTEFGKSTAAMVVRGYDIAYIEKVQDTYVARVVARTKSVEHGLKDITLYFIIVKEDGVLRWEQIFTPKTGIKDMNAREALAFYVQFAKGR